ncbi:MAG: hypothetical protein JST45_04975 [Bacteroidetes bacterium]|nr:hypothetical protein [Bacteroidota bacterium]
MSGSNLHRGSHLAVLLCCCTLLSAQSTMDRADSLKTVIAQQRATLVQADSTRDRQAGFEARMHLSELVGRSEAIAVMTQAAALADSMDRPDLGAMAHRLLAGKWASAGAFGKAYVEAVAADSLQVRSDRREAEQDADLHARELQRMAGERDSLLQVSTDRERRMAQAMVELQRKTDAWRNSAIAALLVGLLLVVGLLYRMGRTSAKLRGALSELRAEVEALKTKPVRTAPVVPTKVDPTPAVVSAEAAMEKVAAGKFHQDAPERLATLQEARKRGDVDKALRVLATLKPQLLAYDAARFSPLIASLRTPNAAAHAAQWNADLDLLEAAIRELWAHHGGQ